MRLCGFAQAVLGLDRASMREKRLAVAIGLGMVGLGLLPAGASASTRVYVSPARGRPTTHFVLRFRAPESTGRIGVIRRTDHLYISSAKHTGCISSVRLTIKPLHGGEHVTITIRPKPRTHWCVGRFRGRIVRTEALICSGSCAGRTSRSRAPSRGSPSG